MQDTFSLKKIPRLLQKYNTGYLKNDKNQPISIQVKIKFVWRSNDHRPLQSNWKVDTKKIKSVTFITSVNHRFLPIVVTHAWKLSKDLYSRNSTLLIYCLQKPTVPLMITLLNFYINHCLESLLTSCFASFQIHSFNLLKKDTFHGRDGILFSFVENQALRNAICVFFCFYFKLSNGWPYLFDLSTQTLRVVYERHLRAGGF